MMTNTQKYFERKKMKLSKFLAIATFLTFTSLANSAPLNPNGPEAKQLAAMGYDIKILEGTDLTIASLGTTKILFDKTDERLVIFRMFTAETKKNQRQRLEILEILNQINIDNAYQVSLEDGSMNIALYKFGAYDAKTFGTLIRLMERANAVFDKYPKLIELLK